MTVLELRQYMLHPGMRDMLVEIFDRHFVEGQEECGMDILGQFRDLDDPDRFVWLRGFVDMKARKEALERFYGGPVWAAQRADANATMVDFSDVLLLKPAWEASGLRLDRTARPPIGAAERSDGEVAVRIAQVAAQELADYSRRFREHAQEDASLLAAYVTDASENNYPALPVRRDSVFVSFHDASAVVPDDASDGGTAWLRLAPTARSLLRGGFASFSRSAA